jgi:hypothetical protein
MSRSDRADRPAKRAEKKLAVIELHTNHGLSAGEAFLKRLLPAAVVSAGVHLFFAVGAFLLVVLMPTAGATPQMARVDVAVEEQTEAPREENLTETTPSIDVSSGDVVVEDKKLDDVSIQSNITSNDPIGNDGNLQQKLDNLLVHGAANDRLIDPGMSPTDLGVGVAGGGAGGVGIINQSMIGRTPASRDNMLKTGGGNKESETAVAKGLTWLARMQKKDGTWAFDNGGDKAAATGLGLLPFLAAGQTHKGKEAENKYRDNVAAAIAALLKMQKSDGSFSGNTYANAIATVALCEAFGMTGDKTLLLTPCQKAVDLIQKGQGANGSWGYKYGDEGDTSIVGWQVQALHSAKMCRELKVSPAVLVKAMKFLDSVATKPKGSSVACTFGYSSPGARPSLTAVGLLCRYYLNGWGPNSAGLQDGVDYLLKEHPPEEKQEFDMYYYYYATQVAHFREGEQWAKEWNPKMRDMLIKRQVNEPNKPQYDGSWDKDDTWIGNSCGRMGTTAMAVLTLEVYYRHLPLYNRGTGGKSDLDGK